MDRFIITRHDSVPPAPELITVQDLKTGETHNVTGEANLRALLQRLEREK